VALALRFLGRLEGGAISKLLWSCRISLESLGGGAGSVREGVLSRSSRLCSRSNCLFSMLTGELGGAAGILLGILSIMGGGGASLFGIF
jgi:hypothetical protein